jgi:Mrp family chromosome partitioning ATPase
MMSKKWTPIIFDEECDPMISESYRLLKTHLQFVMNGPKPIKTFLITSSGPGEGKSTVTTNLGFSLAQDGANVLLVDCDLRFPTLHKIFGIQNSTGLTDAVKWIYEMEVATGVLGEQGLGDILQFIKFQEKTGSLRIEENQQIIELHFERGKITDAVWKNRPIEKRLGTMLLKEGKITESQLTEALQKQEKTSDFLGHILINLRYTNSQDVNAVVCSQATDSLHEVFELKKASFAFHRPMTLTSKRRRLHNTEIRAVFSREVEDRIEFHQPLTEDKVDTFIKDTKFKNIKLMTVGSPASNPSELLSSEKMKSLVKILSNKFDYILFDSPPVTLTVDASILGSFLDGVILVVRAGQMSINVIQGAKEELEKVKANIIGVVMNQFDAQKNGYHSNYYQYHYVNDKKDKVGVKGEILD